MRFKFFKLKLQKSQKKRHKTKYTYITDTKYNRIITQYGGRFEFIYFFFIKKYFKKICLSLNLKKRKVFFFCTQNYPLTKKAKNSRMGSGKGYFLRWVFLLKKNSTIIKSYNIPFITLQRITKWWNNTLPLKVKCI